jgi:hypothetical protein
VNIQEALCYVNLVAQEVLDKENLEFYNKKMEAEKQETCQKEQLKKVLPEWLIPFFTGLNSLGEGVLMIPGYNVIRFTLMGTYATDACVFTEKIAWVLARAKIRK